MRGTAPRPRGTNTSRANARPHATPRTSGSSSIPPPKRRGRPQASAFRTAGQERRFPGAPAPSPAPTVPDRILSDFARLHLFFTLS
jgi:hypothetical protein